MERDGEGSLEKKSWFGGVIFGEKREIVIAETWITISG
jgi:hypothetical protein